MLKLDESLFRRVLDLLFFYAERHHHRDRQSRHTDTTIEDCPIAVCKRTAELLKEAGYLPKEAK